MSKVKVKKYITNMFFRFLVVCLITIILMIIMKLNVNFKTHFYKQVYDTNFSFDKITTLYNKYFKDFVNKEEAVSKEILTYENLEKYKQAAKLKVPNSYSVPIQESGIVVFIGEKEDYGNVVIIQQINGIDMWYGNLKNVNFKLYDYVKKGDILATCDKYLYILYKKDGKILNYEKYL